MKVVLDTNVLVSGLLCPFGIPGEIVRMVSAGTLQLCHDSRILIEYKEVLLRPKFDFKESLIDSLMDQIQAWGFPVSTKPLSKRLPDPDDEIFLEVALAAKVNFLITGNLKHYPSSKREGIKVVSPSAFLDAYRAH